jgi:hypothetical protein
MRVRDGSSARMRGVMAANAIDLYRQQDRDVEPLQLTRQPDSSRAAQALAIKNDARARAFVGIEMAVAVPIKSCLDQRKRQALPVIAHCLGKDVWHAAEFDRQLAHAAIRVVPSLPSAEKTDHERASRCERQRRGEVRKALTATGRNHRGAVQEDPYRRRNKCGAPHVTPFYAAGTMDQLRGKEHEQPDSFEEFWRLGGNVEWEGAATEFCAVSDEFK